MVGKAAPGKIFTPQEQVTNSKLHEIGEKATYSNFDRTNLLSGLSIPKFQTTAPSSPSAGDLWIDTTHFISRVYNGTSWKPVHPAFVELTNRSGAQIVRGDVVVLDTGNDSSFTTTTTLNDERYIGVAAETIENLALGLIQNYGPALINISGTVNAGPRLVMVSSTARKAEQTLSTGTDTANAIAQVIGPVTDTTIEAFLLAQGGRPLWG